MVNTDWITLVRLIPAEQHNKLVLTTTTGVDLNIETVLRLEVEYIVFRGRISGITDEGRVFFVPYGQIDYMQLNRHVKEEEIHQLYGSAPQAEAERPASGVFAAPSGVFNAVPTTGSRQGASASPATPFAPAQMAPGRQSLPGISALLASGTSNGRGSNPPAPPPATEEPTPPRNSILERLRAQRNSVISNKPPGR
jgi:hypothetical protein